LSTWKIVIIIASAFILAACGAAGPRLNWEDPRSIAGAIKVEHDNYYKTTDFRGPNASKNDWNILNLRAVKSDVGGDVGYQIYVKVAYFDESSWHLYNSASDSKGNSLKITPISREVESCSRVGCIYEEHFGLHVTRAYLKNNQESGIDFKVSGKGAEEVFFISSAYIKAFLAVAK